jgi:hypothetical protein
MNWSACSWEIPSRATCNKNYINLKNKYKISQKNITSTIRWSREVSIRSFNRSGRILTEADFSSSLFPMQRTSKCLMGNQMDIKKSDALRSSSETLKISEEMEKRGKMNKI